MKAIGAYLIGVTAAALLCGLVNRLGVGKMTGTMLRMACGVFMALAVIAPWANLKFEMPPALSGFQQEADALAVQGENATREAMAAIINQQLRTYILDKAECLGLELEVEITLSQAELPVPVAVTLRGDASPYNRQALGEYLEKDLGISKEAQKWIS